jgi:hypothetical protein
MERVDVAEPEKQAKSEPIELSEPVALSEPIENPVELKPLRHLQVKNPHSRDKRIKFYTEGHKYEVDFKGDGTFESNDILSASTMTKVFFPEFKSDEVIGTMMEHVNFEKNHKDLIGLTADQIKEKWKAMGEEARNLGTELHSEIECILNEEKQLVCSSPELKLFSDFTKLAAESKCEPYRTECFVFTDDDTRVAGAIDCLYVDTEKTLGFNPGNYLYVKIVDWKRIKAVKKWNSQRVCGFGPCSRIMCANYFEYSITQHIYKHILENYYTEPTWNGRVYSKFIVTKLYLCPLHPSKKKLVLEECVDYSKEVNAIFELRRASLQKKRNGEKELYPFDKTSEPVVTVESRAAAVVEFDYDQL